MVIIVDANSVAHREKHTMGDLSWQDKKVGIIFGFFKQILKLAKQFNSNEFVFCWDSKTSLRREIYPDYKKNRKKAKTPEEQALDNIAYQQFDLIKSELLPFVGFRNVFEAEGFESDDLIAGIVLKEKKKDFIVVSSDNDMYQLLSGDRVRIYDLGKKRLYTETDFKKDHEIEVADWIGVKALAGCHSDNIKGVKGIGEKTAIKFLKFDLSKKSKAYKSIVSQEGGKIIADNLVLVTLPFPETPFFTLKKEVLNFKDFAFMCENYGFKSFLRKESLNSWRERLNMK